MRDVIRYPDDYSDERVEDLIILLIIIIVFLLKFMNIITIPWIWLLAPFWIMAILVVAFIVIACVAGIISGLLEYKEIKKNERNKNV